MSGTVSQSVGFAIDTSTKVKYPLTDLIFIIEIPADVYFTFPKGTQQLSAYLPTLPYLTLPVPLFPLFSYGIYPCYLFYFTLFYFTLRYFNRFG